MDFNDSGFLSLESDHKTAIAVENLDVYPLDINSATDVPIELH